jgi:hypothetical protein
MPAELTDSMSEAGQGRLWSAGGWHSRSTPSFGIPGAFRHLRFVPTADLSSHEVDVDAGGHRRLWAC